jgi:hypothetical protein
LGNPSTKLQPADYDIDLGELEAKAKAIIKDLLSDDEDEAKTQVAALKKKKKKRSKPKAPNPTGFEEYYVDPPITPTEYEEEQSLYHPDKPFEVRIQSALARYCRRRRFNEVRQKIFDKYMKYGGFGDGTKMFQGQIDEKSGTAEDITALRARYFLDEEIVQRSEVDFDGVVKGFLYVFPTRIFQTLTRNRTSYLLVICDLYREDQIKDAVGTIRNFLNYLLQHEVAPEYKDQITAARRTCDMAQSQLILCTRLVATLPGKFNEACSILFGGYYQDTFAMDRANAIKLGIDPGLTEEEARKIFMGGFAAYGEEATFNSYNQQTKDNKITIVRDFETFFEVAEIFPLTSSIRAMYAHPSMAGFEPVGRFKARTWYLPQGSPEEYIKEEKPKVLPPIEQFEFLVDMSILDRMFVGLKLQAHVRQTSFGLWYFESIGSALCSFYTYLPNEAMIGWKPHRELLPKKKNPDAENEQELYVFEKIKEDNIPENDKENADLDDMDGDSD